MTSGVERTLKKMNFFAAPKTVFQYIKLMNYISIVFGISCCSFSEGHTAYEISPFPVLISLGYIFGFLVFFGFKIWEAELNLQAFVFLSGTLSASMIIFGSVLNFKKFAKLLNHILIQEQKFYLSNIAMAQSISLKFLILCVSIFVGSLTLDCIFFKIFSEKFLLDFSIYVFYSYNLLTISQISICLFWTKRCLYKVNQVLVGLNNFDRNEIIIGKLDYVTYKKFYYLSNDASMDVKLKVGIKIFMILCGNFCVKEEIEEKYGP